MPGNVARRRKKLTRFLINELKVEDTFYDIGANYGFYSFLALQINLKGSVHAFEPNPKVYRYVEKNLNLGKNFFLNKYALSNTSGETTLFDAFNQNQSGSSTLLREAADKRYSEVKISTITLDEYVNNKNQPPTIIKIDVEGAEKLVLEGAQSTLREFNPTIIMEVWGGKKGKRFSSGAVEYLSSLGYTKVSKIGDMGEKEYVGEIDFFKMKDNFENYVFEHGSRF